MTFHCWDAQYCQAKAHANITKERQVTVTASKIASVQLQQNSTKSINRSTIVLVCAWLVYVEVSLKITTVPVDVLGALTRKLRIQLIGQCAHPVTPAIVSCLMNGGKYVPQQQSTTMLWWTLKPISCEHNTAEVQSRNDALFVEGNCHICIYSLQWFVFAFHRTCSLPWYLYWMITCFHSPNLRHKSYWVRGTWDHFTFCLNPDKSGWPLDSLRQEQKHNFFWSIQNFCKKKRLHSFRSVPVSSRLNGVLHQEGPRVKHTAPEFMDFFQQTHYVYLFLTVWISFSRPRIYRQHGNNNKPQLFLR